MSLSAKSQNFVLFLSHAALNLPRLASLPSDAAAHVVPYSAIFSRPILSLSFNHRGCEWFATDSRGTAMPQAKYDGLPSAGSCTLSEAIAFLRVSRRTLYRYLAEGLLTRYRVGRRRTVLDVAEVRSLRRQQLIEG